jgi:hypothetical protein
VTASRVTRTLRKMTVLMMSFDTDDAGPLAPGTIIRVCRTKRLGRVVGQHGSRFAGASGRFYHVAHDAAPVTTCYWHAEIEAAVADTLKKHMDRIGHRREGYKTGTTMPPEQSLKLFRENNWDDFSARTGGAGALVTAYGNAFEAAGVLRDTLAHLEQHDATLTTLLSDEANYGAALAAAAGQMVNAALLTHLRSSVWYEHATLLMLRSALEMISGAAELVLAGPGSKHAWLEAGDRFNAAGKTLPTLNRILLLFEGSAPDAVAVYSWLSEHTHFTKKCFDGPPSHEDAYAALAYVSWAAAVVAGALAGWEPIARWPQSWPARLPWASMAE